MAAAESVSRSVRMSACGPHGNDARSKRGSRSASCVRHHAAISSTSALIRGASSTVRSAPSEGIT